MENLSTLKTLYEQDRTNDSILLSILHNVIEHKSGTFLTEKGQQYLSYLPSKDLSILDDKEESRENVQRRIVCLGLYFTLIYVSATLFLGLMEKPEDRK